MRSGRSGLTQFKDRLELLRCSLRGLRTKRNATVLKIFNLRVLNNSSTKRRRSLIFWHLLFGGDVKKRTYRMEFARAFSASKRA